MSSDPQPKQPGKPSNCRIAEIVQYKCDVVSENGRDLVHCIPLPRIFRICSQRPAVEITRLVQVDLVTGEVDVLPELSQNLPKARPWRDIYRYDSSSESDNGHPKMS